MTTIPEGQSEKKQSNPGESALQVSLYWMLAGAIVLFIPTLFLLLNANLSDAFISRHITESWHAGMYQALGNIGISLPEKIVSFAMDGLTWLCIAAFGIGYFKFLRQKKTPRLAGRDLLLLGCIGMLLMLVVPFHSQDVYGYINRGAQQAFYGLNPYMTPVGDMPNWQADPIFQSHWLGNPCPYGFFYAQIAKFLALLGGHHFFLTFIVFKLSALVVHVFNSYLVYRLCNLLSRPNALWLSFSYGLNPLVLMHQISNGHNDGFLALGLLASLFALWQARTAVLAWPALMLSVWTKYASLLASPFMVIDAIKRRQFGKLFLGAVLALLVLAGIAWPYVQDFQHLPFDKMSENAGISQHSIQSAIVRSFFYSFGSFVPDKHAFLETLRLTLKKIGLALFAIFYGWRIWRYWKTSKQSSEIASPEEESELLFEIVLAMAVYLLAATAKFHAWYLGMVLPFAFLLDTKQPNQQALFSCLFWVSIFQLLSFTPLENIHVIGVLVLTVLPVTLVFRHPKFKSFIPS